MKILILNWRDIQNPSAGGAEVLTHEVARRWVGQGHHVTLLASRFPGSADEAVLDGVQILRCGNSATVYWHAARVYRTRFRGRCDVVLDEINTLPFFTPWYVREPLVAHFNQMAREVWFSECWWPLSLVGYLLEPWWLRVYRRTPVITISDSSRRDLVALGFLPAQITVMSMGVDHAPMVSPVPPKADVPTVIFVGRLKRSKRVHDVVRAFRQVRDRCPSARLWIAGQGDRPYTQRLVRMVRALGLDEAVRFFGRVPEMQKQALMAQAHVIAVASVREGWGLIVTEANRYGTPAVVYGVPGLVDSTVMGVNGLICPEPTPAALAAGILHVLQDPGRLAALAETAKASAARMTWDRGAETALATLRRSTEGADPAAGRQRVGSLSVVVPTCDRCHAQTDTLRQVAALVQAWDAPCDVVVVGDEPGQRPVLERLRALGVSPDRIRTVPYDPARGRLCVLPQAVEHVSAEWLLQVDPYLACAAGQLHALLEAAAGGADVVTVVKASRADAHVSIVRRAMQVPGRWLIRRLFGLPVADCQTGLKLFRFSVLQQVIPRIVVKEFAFDLEILAVAHRFGARIISVPLRLTRPLSLGRVRIATVVRMGLDLLAVAYRMHWLRFYDRPFPRAAASPSVSVVIAVSRWNPWLAECLQRCLALDYPAHEILVLPDDEFPPPDPRIRVIPTGPVNPGLKRDLGVRASRGEIVAFLDDDAMPTKSWIRNAVRHFAYPSIGAVGGPAPTPADDSWRQQVSGAIYGSWMMGGSKGYRYIPYPARAVQDLPTCNLFVRRSALDAIGGFNTDFWPGEDTVMCSKIVKDLRQRIWYDPDVLVFHHRRPVFKPHLRQLRRYAEHRGYFVKRFPANSLEPAYFVPTALVCVLGAGWLPALVHPSWWWVYAVVVGTYLALAFFAGLRSFSIRSVFAVTAGIIASNVTYGVFFIKGLLSARLPEERP